jgi:hypothetical protein
VQSETGASENSLFRAGPVPVRSTSEIEERGFQRRRGQEAEAGAARGTTAAEKSAPDDATGTVGGSGGTIRGAPSGFGAFPGAIEAGSGVFSSVGAQSPQQSDAAATAVDASVFGQQSPHAAATGPAKSARPRRQAKTAFPRRFMCSKSVS